MTELVEPAAKPAPAAGRLDQAAPRGAGLAVPAGSSPGHGRATSVAAAELVTLHDLDPAPPIRLSVIVPTRNEAESVPTLLRHLGPAIAPLSAEIIIVDDSDDDTPEVVARHAAAAGVAVRLLHRAPGERRGGLGGAVVAGARHARGGWVLVMDADLQHPPEAAAMLARTAMRHDVDVVVGTRNAGAGAKHGLDGAGRVVASSWATRLAKLTFPRDLATVTDPMSGLFAFRRSAVDLNQLAPLGFKVLLELLVRHDSTRVAEVAYVMAPRHAGRSKASPREGLRFLRHLARLRVQRWTAELRTRPTGPRERAQELGRMVGFGLIGLAGIAVNTAALWAFHTVLSLHHLLGAALATQFSTVFNSVLIDRLVYRHGRAWLRVGRIGRFLVLNNLLLLLRLPALQLLVWAGAGVLVANAATLMGLFLLRFGVSDRIIYAADRVRRRDPVRLLVDVAAASVPSLPSRKRYQYLEYRYDLAGVATIGSQIRLPELEFFRAQWVADAELDITVRVGDVGSRRLRRRAAMTECANQTMLRYEEHLGRLGANFRVELGSPINVQVGPLLARSPHVVYTNIIEAMLRFVMVSRGRMLLHSACVSLDGVGVMLSALTDTGKTATVLRLLRDYGGLFLSDDMTVIDAHGTATCFPKPLTISAHTLRAVQAADLTPREWRRLHLQSRLHSKGGRSLALTLSRFNLPIMGINALTQALVPPPKYSVDRLVPCQLCHTTVVRELFLIERGSPRVEPIGPAATLERLIRNTDDAYGFPPFRYLAPAISVGGQGYAALREQERQILAQFLANVRTRVVASDCFGWADEIPKLLCQGGEANLPAQAAPERAAAAGSQWPRWTSLPIRSEAPA